MAKGDYLGKVAERYLDDFEDYRELAALNRLRDPDRIRPGQLIKLPSEAADQGSRPHATGRLVTRAATPPSPGPATPERAERKQQAPDTAQPDGILTPVAPAQPGDTPQPSETGNLTPVAPAQPGDTPQPSQTGNLTPVAPAPKGGEHAPPGDHVTGGHPPVVTVGAASASEPDRVNRPLAVSAVLAVASIVGAQIGAVLGMRRRVAVARAGGGGSGYRSARRRAYRPAATAGTDCPATADRLRFSDTTRRGGEHRNADDHGWPAGRMRFRAGGFPARR